MREIDKQIATAVEKKKPTCYGNTCVTIERGDVYVYLHGHLIYKDVKGVKSFTLAGWDTDVTRNRLNALGCDISHKKGVSYFRGKPIDKNCWYER